VARSRTTATPTVQPRSPLAANPSNHVSTYTWAPIRADVSSDGTTGYTYGYSELRIPATATAPARVSLGKYIAAWRRSGGTWKVTALVRNPRPAGPVSETPPAGFETPATKHRRYLPNTPAAATLAEIMDADRAFSQAGDAGLPAAFVAFAAPDAALIGGPATFVFGAEAIRQDIQPLPAELSFTWGPVEGEAAASGDLGWTVGVAVVRERATGAVLGYSKYLTIWQRQDDGAWRYVMDGGSPMPQP
jgi:ketosteroid isomerase-like protein